MCSSDLHGIIKPRPFLRDVAGTAGAEPAPEGVLDTFDMSGVAQVSRVVRAADHSWIAGKPRCTFKSPLDAETVEHGRHAFCPLDASAARCRKPGLQDFTPGSMPSPTMCTVSPCQVTDISTPFTK